MINVFETREITLDGTSWKANLERISDWRKGIAIARYYKSSQKPSWNYFLIDKDYNYLLKKSSYDENEIDGEQIERVFGGYYIIRDVKIDRCITFPGQDRDTVCYYSTCITDIVDENGHKLSNERKKEYLKANPIKQTKEYGDDIVECESSFYRLDTYQYLFSISKSLKPIGLFKDERCKVGVVSDYRDYYIVVKEREITMAFEDKQFGFIEKLLKMNKNIGEEEEIQNKYSVRRYKPVSKPAEITDIKTIEPEAIIEIQNYSLQLSGPYEMYGGGYKVLDDNYGIKRFKFMPTTCYYHIDNEWRKIEGTAAQRVYDKIFEQQCNRPNFIKDIMCIAEEIILFGEKYSIFKFECRPYGYITKDGKFDYNFDVNNIKW